MSIFVPVICHIATAFNSVKLKDIANVAFPLVTVVISMRADQSPHFLHGR